MSTIITCEMFDSSGVFYLFFKIFQDEILFTKLTEVMATPDKM